MKVRLWGTRGSIASASPDTVRYGGNTSCVEVRADDGTMVVLDAGTGIRGLGRALGDDVRRIDLLLTHLHMDHIQGLGFFRPLFHADREIHIWGPPSTNQMLRARLNRYLSPPLFPVRLHEVDATLELHDTPLGPFQLCGLEVRADSLIHPGPTVGYRISDGEHSLAYLPDHEPSLGAKSFPEEAEWTSGYDLARDADLLIHDAQYTPEEYDDRIGWGHSCVPDTVAFALLTGARRLVTFHHDPEHSDDELDRIVESARAEPGADALEIIPGRAGTELVV